MSGFKSPFYIGNLKLRSNVFCSPLAGCSDLPFRRIIHQYNPGLFFCEMVKMDALVRSDPHTFRILDYDRQLHPTAAQLVGSKKEIAAESAKIIEDLGFDLVDLNCGCPVDKVTKDGSGSGMLKTPDHIGDVVAEMVNAVKIPVTIKIRAGWNEESINGPEIVRIAEAAGAKAIFVHGRTRSQGYKGPAKWEHIRECKKAAKEILVFGNGDIFTADKAVQMYEETGCDGFLVSRGSFGKPWIFEDIERKFQGLPPVKRTGLDLKEAMFRHMEQIIRYRNEKKSIMDIRRIGCWHFKLAVGTKKLRESLNKCKKIEEVKALFDAFSWEEVSLVEDPIPFT